MAGSSLRSVESSAGANLLLTSHDLVGVSLARFQGAERYRVVFRAALFEGGAPVTIVIAVLHIGSAVLVGCPGDGRRGCSHITYGWAGCDLHRLFQRLFACAAFGGRLLSFSLAIAKSSHQRCRPHKYK